MLSLLAAYVPKKETPINPIKPRDELVARATPERNLGFSDSIPTRLESRLAGWIEFVALHVGVFL